MAGFLRAFDMDNAAFLDDNQKIITKDSWLISHA